MKEITLTVNNETYHLTVAPNRTLADVLRNELSLTGTKIGCDTGDCGACTVLLGGEPVNSCLVLIGKAHGKQVLTIEGLAQTGIPHPLQQAFVEHGAIQCGYCSPGMILSAYALCEENPEPREADIRQALVGNLCRCTGYVKIIKAIQAYVADRKGEVANSGGRA